VLRTVIIRTYLRGWFCIDFVSCIPVQYLTMLFQDEDGVGEGNNCKCDSSRVLQNSIAFLSTNTRLWFITNRPRFQSTSSHSA
jgi:hypothetical protein